MLEFLQTNWLWLLLGAGVIGFLFRRSACGTGSHASRGRESSETKATSSSEEHSGHVEEQPRRRRTRHAGHGCC